MLEALHNRANYQIAKQMMDVTHERHKALASNIANFENPGYKRIEVARAFQAELHKAVAAKDIERIKELRPTLEVDPRNLPERADGNNVSLESELLEMNQNSLRHDFAQQMVSSSIKRLNMAIKGQNM